MVKKARSKSPNDWGQRLYEILREKEISTRKAAKYAGVSSSSVIDSWLKSSSPNDLMAVSKLCEELEVSFKWLLTGKHENPDRMPSIAEIYDETPYFDGLARIRIDRLIPRSGKK